MPMTLLTVDVTEADIAAGTSHPGHCPVALAANRALALAGFPHLNAEWDPYHRAFFAPDGFTVHDRGAGPGLDEVARVPVREVDPEAYEFASLFDDWAWNQGADDPDPDAPAEPPEPFSFVIELDLPRPAGG